MDPTHLYGIIGVAAGALVALLFLYHFVFRSRRLDRQRRQAAKHHEWDNVLLYGEKQAALCRTPSLDLAHDLAQALSKKGRIDEAFDYALHVQHILTEERAPAWSPAHSEDHGDVQAFFTAPSQYLRSMEILGRVYLERNRADEAEEIFAYLAGLGGRKANRNLQLAEALIRRGDGDGAVAALRKFLSIAPGKATEIKHCLPRLVSYLPENEALRDFEAEFLRLQGTHRPRQEELAAATSSGTISKGDFLLYHALCQRGKDVDGFCAALAEGGAALAKRPEIAELVVRYAEACHVSTAQISALEADLEAGQAVGEKAKTLAQDSNADVGSRLKAVRLLLCSGMIMAAHDVMGDLACTVSDAEVQDLRLKVTELWRAQRVAENRAMLRGERADRVELDYEGTTVTALPSPHFQAFCEGQPLSDEARRSCVYCLAGDLLDLGGSQEEATRLLQEVASSGGALAIAARLRLARVLLAGGDMDTALQYLSSVGTLINAAGQARESVLEDAYALASEIEKRNPGVAQSLFNEICLIDLSYRDARARRDALRERGYDPTALSKQTEVGMAANEALTQAVPSARGEAAVGMTDLLAAFDTTGGQRQGRTGNAPKIGDVIDKRYRLQDTLGEGGMGQVLRAFDERLRRDVAVKFMTAGGAERQDASARFELEAQLAAKLFKHDGVVTVLDMSEGPVPYIVMEMVEGKSLKDLIGSEALTPQRLVVILRQVADVLAYAHDMGVVHRDIKPANVLVEMQPLRAKVADFGLAKITDDSLGLTKSGTVVGTALYMSPEQIRGKPLDGRSDIYSWGVTAYESCCGSTPFVQGEIAYQHVHVEPPALAERVDDGIPSALVELVMQCLAKKPEDRPQDCHGMCDRLAAIQV